MCDKNFSTKQQHEKHHNEVHENISKKFMCNQCDKCFHNKNHLNVHMNVHITNEVKCEYCKKTYKNEFCLKSHMRRSHEIATTNC